MASDTTTVAGSRDDFMLVRHLLLAGVQAEIGHALMSEALAHGWSPQPADRTVSRARRRWFEQNWPQHHARMAAAAETLGVDQDEVYVDQVSVLPDGSACSATWNPPQATVDGHGLIGRNYDFFTLGAQQMMAQFGVDETAPDDEPPMTSRPYVITMSPSDAPASTVITANDLDGCMEGINEHGLAVALLIANAEEASPPSEARPQVGISSVQLPRFLLDTCANAAEAEQALLLAKQYDHGMPLHYLVADATGEAFVWERGAGGTEHIVRADGQLCVTNHLLHRHPDPTRLPADNPETMLTYRRAATLAKRTGEERMSGRLVREALDEVHFDVPAAERAGLPVRTLWRSVFDVHARTMSTWFYLGDNPDGSLRYSPEIEFRPGTGVVG